MGKLDILNREEFVDNLLHLMENISNNKTSTCFAINGTWGCGKSFVLDLFEEQLGQIQSEETSKEKYFIVRYNSWKYDYYEEPLVAIVSTIISAIEKKTKLFPDNQKTHEILGILKATGVSLLSFANIALKEKTGIDLQKAYEIVRDGEKAGAAEYEKNHDYDIYFNFNKVIAELAEVLQGLAKDYTVVLLVDELDRCAPEYAIKVLERLHHLTEDNTNIITIIAIDKAQLMSSIKQIFGFENPEKYLEKFFNFEVKLNCGTVSERITEKYLSYIELFDRDLFAFDESVEECIQAIFKDIDIRSQEQIFKKVMLAHQLLYSEKKDYSFMCMELILAVMICIYNDESCFTDRPVDITSFKDVFLSSDRYIQPAFSAFFDEKFKGIDFRSGLTFSNAPVSYVLPEKASLYGAIIFTWYWMHSKNPRAVIAHRKGDIYESIANNHDELKRFADTIKMMK